MVCLPRGELHRHGAFVGDIEKLSVHHHMNVVGPPFLMVFVFDDDWVVNGGIRGRRENRDGGGSHDRQGRKKQKSCQKCR
jgi:hypothetical protein